MNQQNDTPAPAPAPEPKRATGATQSKMGRSLPSIIGGGVLVLILVAYMVSYQVRFNEVAVIRTLGRTTQPDETGYSPDVKTEPGRYLRWPWPIQRVTSFDNRIQLTKTTSEEIPTSDGKNVIVTTAVGWQIADPYLFSIRNTSTTEAQAHLASLIRDRVKGVISSFAFTNLVSIDPDELKYDDIEQMILEELTSEAGGTSAQQLYGIMVLHVGFEGLTLPETITEKVFAAMKEEKNAQAASYTAAGESEAARIKAEAESIAGMILAFAQRRADEIVAEGQRRAADANAVFSQDEELAIFLLEMRNLRKILEDRVTVFFDAKPPFDLLLESTIGSGTSTRPAGGAAIAPVSEAINR